MAAKLTRRLPTPNHHGYSVKFCPFNRDVIAVASAQNFGLSGGGMLMVKNLSAPGDGTVSTCIWADGLFDLTFSEQTPNCVVTASGDGSLQLWDITKSQAPIMVYREHQKEAYSLDWTQTRDSQFFVSSSWDGTIKLWDPNREKSLLTMQGHEALVYQAIWSPHITGCVASVSGDQTLRIWNTKKDTRPVMTIRANQGEVLTCDWCKYNQNIIATAGTDCKIYGWDLRRPGEPVYVLQGHGYPVRRIKYFPFAETQLASVSYDLTTRIWDHSLPNPSLSVLETHSEFVYGLDFSNHVEGLLADCAWDQSVGIYHVLKPGNSGPLTHGGGT